MTITATSEIPLRYADAARERAASAIATSRGNLQYAVRVLRAEGMTSEAQIIDNAAALLACAGARLIEVSTSILFARFDAEHAAGVDHICVINGDPNGR